MIPQGLFTQIGIVIVSIAILVTYVHPIFNDVSAMQSDIAVYKEKRESISSVNARLNSLVSRLDSVTSEDRRDLLTYMPEELDPLSVLRDLFLITNLSGAFYLDSSHNSLVTNERSSNSVQSEEKPLTHSFSLAVEGTYEQIKNLILLIEQNNYPLEISDLEMTPLDGGFLSADFTLTTYSYQSNSLESGI